MSGDRDTIRRRVDQFTAMLKPMNQRSHDIARGSCFMIFEDRPLETQDGEGGSQVDDGSVAEEHALASLLKTFRELGLLPLPKDGLRLELPELGWRKGPVSNRFVQFSFERDDFHLDLPRQTLAREEAEQILRNRAGFFYLQDRPEHTLHEEDVEGYDPFRKVYPYGEEASAAADMAFILFHVWKLPLSTRLYVSASAFSKDFRWEQEMAIN